MTLYRRFFRGSIFAAMAMAMATAVAVLGGCGPDPHELMMRAARRPRPPEETEPRSRPSADLASRSEASAEAASAQRQSAIAAPPIAAPPTLAAAGASSATGQPVAAGSEPALSAERVPIARRRPEIPLSDFERRQRSAENLKRIGNGLAAYVAQNGRLPLPAMKTASGIATLSWRVELLPYLGYEELYRQFDVNQPWDSPKNLPLLDLIPDCYVSPERFDSSTNYLGVSGSTYLFNGKPVSLRKAEDGLENTIAIVEVDDTSAVPWTSPADYAPQNGNPRAGLGNLRPDGIYALWANGWTSLLSTTVGDQQLHNAFTYESGDGLVAGDIHNPLLIQETAPTVSSGAPTASGDLVDASTSPANSVSAIANDGPEEVPRTDSRSSDAAQSRIAVPTRSELARATQQVRDLYAGRLKAAVDFAQRELIAQEMLQAAAEMRNDPAGAYTLQSTAARIAVAVGDLKTACQAIDSQVSMFKVDAVERNGAMLVALGRSSMDERAAAADDRGYLRRALPVFCGAIGNDQYDLAESICQFAIRFEAQSSDRSFLADLNHLRLRISTARNQHRRAESAIAQLRNDPSDRSANTTVGRYLAFIKGDWHGGLSLLVEGDDDRLARIAAMDLDTGSSGPTMVSTADAWWELGDSTAHKALGGACRRRAAHWYAKAMETMPESLARMHAQARLREAEAEGPSSPLDAVDRLADKWGIDLQESRASLENPNL